MALTPANAADREVIDELLDNPFTDTASGASDTDTDAAITDHAGHRSESKGSDLYGDSAYADGATLNEQTGRGLDMRAKVAGVRNANGYSKDQFGIDLTANTVTCLAQHAVAIHTGRRQQVARFGALCATCPRCAPNAPGPQWARDHPSMPAKPHCSMPRPANAIRTGKPTTARIGRSWNAGSAISPAAPGVGARLAAAANKAS